MTERVAREKAIEDVFAKYPGITEDVLDYEPGTLTLLNRQQSTDVGRTDLLFFAADEVVLIELKTEPATEEHVDQLERYRDHYESELLGTQYPSASALTPILLAPVIPESVERECRSRSLVAQEFDVSDVLTQFENQLFTGHRMFDQEPVSTGVGSLHYINGLLRYLGAAKEPKTRGDCVDNLDQIAKEPDWGSPKSRMGQFLRLGIRLNLIYQVGEGQAPYQVNQVRITQSDSHLLTQRGMSYLKAMDDHPERVPPVNVEQAEIITDLLYERPFYSKVTTGMVVLLDTVYDLSRSSDRVSGSELEDWYPKKAGRKWEGKSPESLVIWYGNYLDELGLVAQVSSREDDTTYYHITPDGVQLLSYLHVEIGKEIIRSSK